VLRIGELATETGETVKTLRFWEERGLLEAERSETGYRYFSKRMTERSRFIRRAQALGFTLGEIRGVVELRDEGLLPCDDVRNQLKDHLDAIRKRLRELTALESELEERLRWAEAGGDAVCEEDCVYLSADPISGRHLFPEFRSCSR